MIQEIKHIALFQGIDSSTIERLILEREIYSRSYHKGATVYEQGKACIGADVVLSGKLIAYALADNGSEMVVFTFGDGSLIGANLVFAEQNKYPINIYCTEDCVLYHITKSGIEELLKYHEFVMRYVQSLSENSQGMNQKIAMYTRKSLRENLMDYFCALSVEQKSNTISLPATKKQLADYFGVQRPSLFRELKRMKDEEMIEIVKKEITLRF